MITTAAVVRELVRSIGDNRRGLDLLARLLEDLDIRLAGLVPPPPALQQTEQPPEAPPEAVYAEPKRRRQTTPPVAAAPSW